MKKSLLFALTLAAVAGLFIVGAVLAQGENPPFGRGPGDGTVNLYDYMKKAMADALGLQVNEFETRHDAGDTFYELAISEGFAAEEVPALMREARNAALNAAAADGVITQEQAEWMMSRGFGRGGMGYGPGTQNEDCPMYGDGTNFEGRGPGMMNGNRGGGRWKTQNQ
jgi:hypothetical protein